MHEKHRRERNSHPRRLVMKRSRTKRKKEHEFAKVSSM